MTKLLLAMLVLVALYSCNNEGSEASRMTDTTKQQFGDSKIDSTDMKLIKDQLK